MILLNAVLAAAVCVGNYLLLSPDGGATKAFCSACLAALGCANTLYVLLRGGRKGFALMMAAGLLLAMAGDLAIGRSFVLGAALFAAGHICFGLAGCLLYKPGWMDGACAALIFVPAAAYMVLSKALAFRPAYLQWVCVGYALIIALMSGKLLGNFWRSPGLLAGILLAGSLLFCFSDFMLMMGRFSRYDGAFGTLCMAFYYPAEILLAHSVFHSADA